MAPSHRKSFLTLTPVNFSLTDGTDIPAPRSPVKPAEPPTLGGGPLSSHPATPLQEIPQELHRTPDAVRHDTHEREQEQEREQERERERADSFRTPTSPGSVRNHNHSPRQQGVRKLFSLSNLRQSFSSSRTSLSQPRGSTDTRQPGNGTVKRPISPSAVPATTTTTNGLYQQQSPHSVSHNDQRPHPQYSPQQLSKKRSGNWFRRKSGMLLSSSDQQALASVEEDQSREGKRAREHSPAPLLPEIGSLTGGPLDKGSVGWDEQVFRSVTAGER